MRRALAPLIAIALILGTAGNAAASSRPGADHAKLYYVSVGTSLASGVQPIGDPDNMYRTRDGYAEQLLAIAHKKLPKLSLVKLGCPGETTTTMIEGGICSYRHGSQLDEAIWFLRTHRNHVAFITIDMGANDFACNAAECVPDGVAKIQANLPRIVADLRRAAGPGVPIVGMTLHDPFLAAWLMGPDGQAYAQYAETALMEPINGLLRGIFQASGARVADVEGAFASSDFTTQANLPGVGTVPLNVARICTWSWACTPPPLGPDNHPNKAGYGVMARAFAVTLGLTGHHGHRH
jgi:lysophospholipase L1-like esterase